MDNNQNNSRLATVALVCGITSIFILPILFGGAAIIFGSIVRSRAEKGTRVYQNANLGILFGVLGLVFWVLALIASSYLQIDMGTFLGGTSTLSSQSQSAF